MYTAILPRYVMLSRREEDDEYEATFSFYIPKTGEYLLHIGEYIKAQHLVSIFPRISTAYR